MTEQLNIGIGIFSPEHRNIGRFTRIGRSLVFTYVNTLQVWGFYVFHNFSTVPINKATTVKFMEQPRIQNVSGKQ